MPANLNRKQQIEIKAVVERAKKDNGIPQTAQQSIPFQRMFPDGICRVTDSYYTKTIQFQDINYQLAQQEDKTAIFDEWCSFLNFFDSSIHFELSFMNLSTDAESFEKSIRIPFKKDSFNPVRAEYSQTVIDRCVHQIYQRYFDNPAPENMPILEDLYDALLKQDEKEAHHVATALEIYVKGSLKLFNNRTNVDIQNRLVCFDIKGLGNQLKKIGMLIVQDQVWGRVTANRSAGKSTRYYIDEFHLLLKEEQTATYSVEIWKRFRKWGGLPTGITQNVKDLLRSPEIANILENSDFIYMLNQASDDRSILAQRLNISPHQLSYDVYECVHAEHGHKRTCSYS